MTSNRNTLARLAFAGAHVFVLLMVLTDCPPVRAAEIPANGMEKSASVRERPWRPLVMASGKATAHRSEVLTAPVAMTVRTLDAKQPGLVEKGQTLMTFSSPELVDLVVSVADANKQLDLRRNYRKQVENWKARAVTTLEVKYRADADVLAARAALHRQWSRLHDVIVATGHDASLSEVLAALVKSSPAQVAAAYGNFASPLKGAISTSAIASGMRLAKGAALFHMRDTAVVFIDVELPPRQAAALQGYEADAETSPGKWQPLTFVGMAPGVDARTGLATIRYSLDNRNTQLLDGQWMTVRLRGPSRPAFWVPAAAVVARNGRSYCIVAKSGAFKPTEVMTGASENGMVPVLSGLSAGEKVVTAGAYELLYRDLSSLIQQDD